MRNFLKCSSFIRMAIIIVVMAFLAGQVTDTDARGKKWKDRREDCTSGGGHTGGACDPCEKLDQILAILEDGCNDGGDGGGFPCRDGGTPVGDRWVVSDSGAVVCDLDTGYSWQQHPLSLLWSWEDANDYCSTLGDGWSAPTRDQIQSLTFGHDAGPGVPPLPTDHPFSNIVSDTPLARYWTSEEVEADVTFAWYACMGCDNGQTAAYEKYIEYYVWCVRGGP